MWYKELYKSCRFAVLDVSVVVTLDKTASFQAPRASCSSVDKLESLGTSSSTLLHAWADDMKETPTREVTFGESNVKTAPRRAVEETLGVLSYETRFVDVAEVPRNVLYSVG